MVDHMAIKLLHNAIKAGNRDEILHIINSRPYILAGYRKSTKLLLCAIEKVDDIAIIDALICAGANLDGMPIYHHYHVTPLMYAAKHNLASVAQLLIIAGADLNITEYGHSALWYAVHYGGSEIAHLLMNAGINYDPATMVSTAERVGKFELAELMHSMYSNVTYARPEPYDEGQAYLHRLASFINFLLISDGGTILQYST